jgi:hypothetical protein
MSTNENNITHTERKPFTVIGKYANAQSKEREINEGDTCVVEVGAPFQPGDIVLFECSRSCATDQTTPHHHAQYYSRLNGKMWNFRLSCRRGGSSKLYKDDSLSIIIGPVVEVIKPLSAVVSYDTNAGKVRRGDRVTYEPSESYKDGELVLVDDGAGGGGHVARVYNVKGKRWKYFTCINRESYGRNRTMHRGDDGDCWRILGRAAP